MFLNQSNTPRLWLFFQRLIGGRKDKQTLALSAWDGQRNILEIGCSVGNIANAFRTLPNIHYTGIDIDEKVIDVTKSRFTSTEFLFPNESIEKLITNAGMHIRNKQLVPTHPGLPVLPPAARFLASWES